MTNSLDNKQALYCITHPFKMKSRFLILCHVLALNLSGQEAYNDLNISQDVKEIVEEIEEINMVGGSAVGEAGRKPKQYQNFENLREKANIKELIELTMHPNAVVRVYGFWGLLYTDYSDFYSIVKNHISDNEYVHTQFGCIASQMKVGDFFIELVTPGRIDSNSSKLNQTDLAQLDSTLIYESNNLSNKHSAINRAKKSEKLYPRLRFLAVNQKNQSALVAIAKFKKEQDVEIILKNRSKSKSDEGGYFYTYKAISKFPHPSFFPLLEANLAKTLDNTHYSNEWRQLYKAIASYQNEEAVKLLKIPFENVVHYNMRKYHLDYIYDALKEFKTPIYDNLLWRLWEHEDRITGEVYDYLSKRDSKRAFELTKKSLSNSKDFYNANLTFDYGDRIGAKSLADKMLDLAWEKDKNFTTKTIVTNLEKSSVHLFPVFTRKVLDTKGAIFINPLLNRINKESNAHIYLEAIATLIAYNEPEINKKILLARRKNKKLNKDWGGKALDELLKKHNIN